MKIFSGMEQVIFSYAYYKISDFEKVTDFLVTLEEKGIFVTDRVNLLKKEIFGTFIRDYPKGHWNSASRTPGAKQVVGGVQIKGNTLKIDTRTKGALQELRNIFESQVKDSITFEKVEFEDLLANFKKKYSR